MKKVIFKNLCFFYGLIIFIIILLLLNLVTIFSTFEIKILLPIIIQTLLLVLIFEKHIILKLILKIWSGIFFIAAFGMKLFGMFLKDISYDFQTFNIQKYLLPTFMLLIGVLIFVLTDKTVEKVK